MPIFNQCCFCVPLPTGGIILGAIGVLHSLIAIIYSSIGLSALNDLFDKANRIGGKEGQIDLIRVLTTIIFVLLLIVHISVLICSVLLIIGSLNKRKEFILPFLITEAIGIFFIVFFVFVNIANGVDVAGSIIFIIIYLLIFGYLWLCVFSLYQWIKESGHPPAGVAPTGGVAPTAPAAAKGLYPEQQVVYSTMA